MGKLEKILEKWENATEFEFMGDWEKIPADANRLIRSLCSEVRECQGLKASSRHQEKDSQKK